MRALKVVLGSSAAAPETTTETAAVVGLLELPGTFRLLEVASARQKRSVEAAERQAEALERLVARLEEVEVAVRGSFASQERPFTSEAEEEREA